LAASTGTLRQIYPRRPLIENCTRWIEAAQRGEREWDGTKPSSGLLFVPLGVLALLGDRSGVEWLDEKRASSAFTTDAEAYDEQDDMLRQLLHIYRGGAFDERVFKMKRKARPGEWHFGYCELPRLIAKRDWASFASLRAELERDYQARGRSKKESGLNIAGYGKIGQLASFDFFGVMMSRFALWCGFDIEVDTPLYPRAFYAQSH